MGSSFIGLRMHVLEAGHEPPGLPLVLLLHGFCELAYSWRKVMPALGAAGFAQSRLSDAALGLLTNARQAL
jgi:alpha-beta hydrolase superfamily lysophospholipase